MGHLEDFLLDTARRTIRYIVVDTRNWLAGEAILLQDPPRPPPINRLV